MYLIYSAYWGDWDFCNSSMLDDINVLGYVARPAHSSEGRVSWGCRGSHSR
jgi:hypothetical protein